jgi:hypothetical protein
LSQLDSIAISVKKFGRVYVILPSQDEWGTGRVAARSLALDHWLFATRFLSVDAGSNGSGIEIHLLLVPAAKVSK